MANQALRKYGVEATIDFELYEVDGVDLRTDWVPAAADCEVMKDGGTSTQCTNTATDEGSTYSIVLTATEMQAARLVLKIVDAATKVFLDKVVIIETYGNASAQHAVDLDDSVRAGLTALPNVAAGSAGGLPDDTDSNGAVRIVDGTGAREINTNAGAVALVDLVTTTTTNTDMRGTDSANTVVPPSVSQFNARTLLAADYFDPAADAVANVTLVATTTTNTDMVAAAPTAAVITDAVWDELLSGHVVSGSAGEALSAAGTAGDPWTTALPGAYGAGTAGEILGDWKNGGRLDLILDATSTSTEVSNLQLATVQKNVAFLNFEFPMRLTSDHYTAATGKTVTGERSIDGGAFVSVTGTGGTPISEVGDGVYQFDSHANDTNGDSITWKFSATDCDDTIVTFKTST